MVEETENWDDSLIKCNDLGKIIPSMCTGIKQIRLLDKRFELDSELKMAERLLRSLGAIECVDGRDGKASYVNEYRDTLSLGLVNLQAFFEKFSDMQQLTSTQKKDLSMIASQMILNQQAISRVAG